MTEVRLTPREQEVLDMLCRGVVTDSALAQALSVSEATVDYHFRQILQKFNVNNRTELVVRVFRDGVIDAA